MSGDDVSLWFTVAVLTALAVVGGAVLLGDLAIRRYQLRKRR